MNVVPKVHSRTSGLISIQFIIVSVPSAIIYGLLFAIAIQAGVDPTVLVRDPATISNVPFYFGLISNLGVLIWAVAASVSAFADISQMDSNAFINALYWDGTTVRPLADVVNCHLQCPI